MQLWKHLIMSFISSALVNVHKSTTSASSQFGSVKVYFCPEMTIDRNFVDFSIMGDLYSKTVLQVHKVGCPIGIALFCW